MTYFLFFSAIILGLVYKKNKIITVYIASVMFVLAAFCTSKADLDQYKIGYLSVARGQSSYYRYKGYSSFVSFFASKLGLDFEEYLMAFFLITILMLLLAVMLLTKNVNQVMALYLVFPYAMEVVQMKQMLANCTALIGICILFKGIEKKDNDQNRWLLYMILSYFLVIQASLLHFSAVFFVISNTVFLLTRSLDSIKKTLRIVLALSVVMIIPIYLGLIGKVFDAAANMGLIKDMEYLEQYAEKKTNFGFLLSAFMVALMVICCLKKKDNDPSVTDGYVQKYMMTSMMTVPFIIIHTQFDRLLRIYIILMLVFVFNNTKHRITDIKRVGVSFFSFYGVEIVFVLYLMSFYEFTLGSIFKYNSLIK